MMKTSVLLTTLGLLALSPSAFAQNAYGQYDSTGGVRGAAPQSSTTAGDVSPISGGNGGVGGTPGNTAASGTSAGPGSTGAAAGYR